MKSNDENRDTLQSTQETYLKEGDMCTYCSKGTFILMKQFNTAPGYLDTVLRCTACNSLHIATVPHVKG